MTVHQIGALEQQGENIALKAPNSDKAERPKPEDIKNIETIDLDGRGFDLLSPSSWRRD